MPIWQSNLRKILQKIIGRIFSHSRTNFFPRYWLPILAMELLCHFLCTACAEAMWNYSFLSLSRQLLFGKLILPASGTSLQLLALSLDFSPAKRNLPLEGFALPHEEYFRSSLLTLLKLEIPLEICYTALCHLQLYLWLNFSCWITCTGKIELSRSLSICTGVFSKCPSTSSYNPLLEHQRPRLKHNWWPILFPCRSVCVSRTFSPWLN